MGRAFETITPPMQEFIATQHMFFVATAPGDGHVNLSPKGYDSFRILDANRVAYLDLTGSGAETIAHVRENKRITFMFCAFEGKPNIVRLYGSGTVVLAGDDQFSDLFANFAETRTATDGAVRSIIVADIHRTSTACGFSVPFMDYVEERDRLLDWAQDKTDDDLADYWATKNAVSIDGHPAMN